MTYFLILSSRVYSSLLVSRVPIHPASIGDFFKDLYSVVNTPKCKLNTGLLIGLISVNGTLPIPIPCGVLRYLLLCIFNNE